MRSGLGASTFGAMLDRILKALRACRRHIGGMVVLGSVVATLNGRYVSPAERLTRKARRDGPPRWPPRHPDGAIDWSNMTYVEVNATDQAWPARSLDELMSGPMKRMFDLCGETEGVRGSARVLEFARGPAYRFKSRHPERADEIERVVMQEVRRRFAHRGSDGAYLIDVFLGNRTHNS